MQSPRVYANRYRLEERLGAGAFGVVYAAFDEGLLQRRVAIKLLRSEEEGGGAERSPEQTARFIDELRLAGALRHPHIAAVYDAGSWDGQLYMVQELVNGEDIGRFLEAHGPLSVSFVLGLARPLLDALAYAHDQGVLHRDIKPGNLLIDADHRVVVVDFGLATSSGPQASTRPTSAGTPGYAAPEQVRGMGDARADQFSLAAVLYQLFTGVAPFVGRNLAETLRRTLLHNPEPPSRVRPDLPPGLDRALMRALSKNPADRYPNLREFAADLLDPALGASLAAPSENLSLLAEAARRGTLVVVTRGDPTDWMVQLRLSLVILLGEGASEAEILDPRQEIYPSPEAPVRLRLADVAALERLRDASEGLRAALVTGCLLALELAPDDPSLRALVAQIRVWSSAGTVIAAAPRWSVESLRAAERRGVGLLEQPLDALRAALAAELPPQDRDPRPAPPERPYKFLSAFDPADEAIFFGRDVELARLHARILARPITLLYGASGAGKTSIIQAALAPRLARAGYRVTITRVFDDPLGEICRAAGVSVDPTEGRVGRLAEAARAARLWVVFVDQLEELFVRFPRAAREQIAADLRDALAASEGHLRLVLCLRADFLARLVELREILPLSLEIGLYLEPLSSAAARQAVEGPAALHGVRVEPALTEQMLADLAGEGFDPPQLQLVCDALWEARDPAEGALTLRAYRALGEARDILARHLASALDGLPEADQSPARDLLKAMVTTHDTRSVRRLAEIARGAGLPPEIARRHLETLARLRLVRPLERDDGTWFELTHEVLAAEIGRWLSEDDRRIQHVRELLEQGIRGYDQLGLLLSQAQLRVVEGLAHRLDMTEAERALIARSRAGEARGRRRVLGGVMAALALVLLGVVASRALWLSHQAFARSAEGNLSRFRWGEPEAQVTSPVTVYRGAADPWFIDRWLGYPRDPYQTDWVVTDMIPAARDALRRGMALPGPDGAEAYLASQLNPVAALRERFVAGDLSGAGEALHALAADPQIGPEGALGLAPVLALSEPDPAGLFGDLLKIAEQRAAALRVPGGDQLLGGQVGQPMGLFLLRTPREIWGPQLNALLSEESGPELVGELLAVAGGPEDIGGLGASLGGSRSANAEAALVAISETGSCAWMDAVRGLVTGGGTGVSRDLLMKSYLELGESCVSDQDLPVLEDLLADMLRGTEYVERANHVLHLIYRLDPARAAALLGQDEPRLNALRQVMVTPWGYLADREMIAKLTPGSQKAIHGRLYLGDASAVWPAWDLAFRDLSDPMGASWLWPLSLYRGQALQGRAEAQLQKGGLPIHLTLPLLTIAARGGDDAAAEAVGTGLASPDLVAVQTALNYLSAWSGPIPPTVGGASRQTALGRAVVALRRGEATPDLFSAVLADPNASWLEAVLAVEGRRRLWSGEAPDAAIQGLRSPFARVRLAATLALAMCDALPPMDPGGDPWLGRALSRVRWTHHALQVDAQLRGRGRAALDQGQASRAHQIAALMRSSDGTLPTIGAVLAPQLPGAMPAEIEDETIYLHMLADMGLGVGTATEWMIAYLPPRMWGRLAVEPHLASQRNTTLLRVLTGQSPPVTVEDPR